MERSEIRDGMPQELVLGSSSRNYKFPHSASLHAAYAI
jgi:hypothetical protein